jgi:acyl-CoA thioester hydrolase
VITLPSSSVDIVIPFHDIDSIGVVWHGHYAKYFEIARCAMLDTIGYGYQAMRESGYMWPVIDLRTRYIKPLLFDQKIKVTATLREWEYRLLIDYLVVDASSGQRHTKGTSAQVAVDVKTHEMCLASPDILLEKLQIKNGANR